MKTILAFSAAMLLATFASATTRYVDINGLAPYSQVQPAIDASSTLDTIVVAPGYGYSGFTVDRRLVIIGAGTSLDATEGTCVGGIVTITDAADSTELQGMWIIAYVVHASVDSSASVLRIRSGARGIFVLRCFVENTASASYPAGVSLGYQCSVQFIQCAIKAATGNGRGIWSSRSGWSLTLQSCIMATQDEAINTTGGSGVIQAAHGVLTSSSTTYILTVSGCSGFFENSAFLSPSTPTWSGLGGVALSYCAGSGVVPPGSNNIVCSTADFISLTSYANPRANDYHLSEGSVLRDAGNSTQFDLDGTRADIGIYGGMHPYVDGGVPDYPFVIDVDVPTSVPQSGAVRVYARGRIGPGY
ncbi:MAG: hypothetical protein FJY66_01110 [Calditrichaeota bacterium]|nr:hypothetical protein [Calditrichota bacterium]